MTGARIALLLTLVVGTAATLAFPYHAVTPGAMSNGHERLANDCLACHTPLRGPNRAKCLACHRLDQVGMTDTDGRPRVPARPRTSLVHKVLSVAGTECYACHGEHSGASRATAAMRFTHAVLPLALRAECLTCHAGERPRDALHANTRASCSECHGSERWKPASFAHETYFRFDRNHPSTCVTCHQVAGDYTRYTCYGCHEHTPAGMAQEHRDERVVDLDRCARCHPSGNEHDIRGREGQGRRRERDDDN